MVSEMCGGRRLVAWIVVGALLALGLTACGGSAKNRVKNPTSVLWIGSEAPALEVSDVARLREAGVGEMFVDAGDFDLDHNAGPLVPGPIPSLPPSTTVTLVVDGELPSIEGRDDVGELVAESARQLRFDVEAKGLLAVGLHFDFRDVVSLSGLASFLDAVRDELEPQQFLSFSVQRDWLGQEALTEASKSVDFLVPFLYGQRLREAEDASAWDFIEIEKRLEQVEALERPYLIGVVTLGTATHLNSRGGVKARKTPVSLQEILWNRDLKLRPGFSLEGVNRRVYSVEAEKATAVGSWQVTEGESIRVVRAATSDLEDLMRLVGASDLPNHLGQLYYRLPKPEERLSLGLGNLLNALDSDPAEPDLYLDASLQRRTGRGWLIRFSITNRNGEITELSLLDNNYLQVRCLNGVFGRADVGDFYRFDLYQERGDELVRTFRKSDLVRFHVPILEGEQKVVSGDVEAHLRGEPQLELTGQFLLPDGRTLELGPILWPRPDGAED